MQLELPSPEYPGLQVQLWDPSVLLQTALMSHLWVLIIHSSTSMKESSNVRKMYLTNSFTARSIRLIPKITSVTEENNFVLNDCLSTAKSNLTITLTTTKQRIIIARYYQCNYFHLQRNQVYSAIMRSLGIITDSIDITVMGVCHTLVNINEEKLQTWEVGGTFLLIFTHVQGSHTKDVGYKKTFLFAGICSGS